MEHLQGAYQVEEKLLKQRLQALENKTVLNLIEGKELSPNSPQLTHFDEIENNSSVLINNANNEETLESYGEF
ncbi:hypothetical protein FD724_35275 (plasmid) [Nostoc sp. C057]|nr:hypothetical protein [Nostoc sp. C057]QLE53199.1 hypothetical protein FD724_35275 [Nostoc sp. C057]